MKITYRRKRVVLHLKRAWHLLWRKLVEWAE